MSLLEIRIELFFPQNHLFDDSIIYWFCIELNIKKPITADNEGEAQLVLIPEARMLPCASLKEGQNLA